MRKVVKFFASVKLAVLILAILAVLISAGTMIESRYDAWTAKNLIYNSIWMYATLGCLVISLIAVIVDRWPWQPKHASFIFAHVGIIIIIFGSLLTHLFGVDGTVRLPRSGEAVKEVTIQETVLNVYRSRSGENYEQVYSDEVNFLKKPIQPDEPYLIKAPDLNFELLESIPYGQAQMKVDASPQSQSGAALRYQLSNANVSEIDWLVQRNPFERAEKQVGSVFVTLGGLWERTLEINEIRLYLDEKQKLGYALYNKKSTSPYATGTMSEGQSVKTKWMDLELRALQFLPKAIQRYEVQAMEYPSPMTRPALRARYNGAESYLLLGDYIKVFTNNWIYLIAYQNKRVPLGFDINLVKFEKSNYPGTMRAMAYESQVQYDDGQAALIFMNEPLKHKDFTLYQASFEEDSGRILASVLSVNHDPGRPWKYLGSLVMCIGVVLLFYFRKRSLKC